MYSKSLTAAAIMFVASAQVVPAQDTTAIAVQYGDRVANQLTRYDQMFDDGSHYRIFGFEGRPGDSVSISLVSEDIDAYLILGGPMGEITRDDDSGGLCNAHVTAVLPDSGTYVIYASGTASGEWGNFTLSLERGLMPPPSTEGCRGFVGPQGTLALGDSVVGAFEQTDPFLRDSTYYEVWLLSGTEGKTFTLDLASTEFDAVLMLLRGISRIVAVDDDGGGGCDSRIVFQNSDAVPLRAVARTRGNWQLGAFALRLSEGAEPQHASTCEGRPAGRPPTRP